MTETTQYSSRRWLILFMVLGAELMDLIDSTIVNVAMPSIQRSLHASYAGIQWIVSAYTLSFAVFLILGARLGDVFGRKRLFVAGVTGFALSSLACGVAPSMEVLIISRGVQGVFAALLIPQGMTIIRASFPPKEMAAAFGMFGPVLGLGAVLGPILGGVLVDADIAGLGWRSCFLINLPIGALSLWGALSLLDSRNDQRHADRIDYFGVLLVGSALLALIYPLIEGRDADWAPWTFASMGASVVLFGVFAWWEVRMHDKGLHPLIELSLFRKRAFVAGVAVLTVFFCSMAGFSLISSLFMQLGLGFSAMRAAVTQAPLALFLAVGAGVSGGILAPKFGRVALQIGVAAMGVGLVLMALTVHRYGVHMHSIDFAPSLAVTGFGMGCVFPALFGIVLASVSDREAGTASGVLNAHQQLGAAVGVAVIGVIFFNLIASNTHMAVREVTPQVRTELVAAGVTNTAAQDQVIDAFATCFHDRATAKDAGKVPASCEAVSATIPAGADGQRIGAALASAGTLAIKRDFSKTMETTMWWVVAFLAAATALTVFLPRVARPEESFEGVDGEPEGVPAT